MLVSDNFPILDCWEVDFQHLPSHLVLETDFDVHHVQNRLVIMDIRPLKVILVETEEHWEIPVLVLVESWRQLNKAW